MNKDANYLITTDGWFYAPDGHPYRAAWGKATIIPAKDMLGFNPTRSTNWYARIGEGDKSVIIAGCKIHFAIQCEEMPKIRKGKFKKGKNGQQFKDNNIYIPSIL